MEFNRCAAICTTHGQQCPNNGCILHDGKWYCKKHDHHGGTMTRRTLQRAAPDLLAALKEIVEYSGGANSPIEDPYVMERVSAAIRKAEGES